jgi:Sarcosine oxidase A3 domain/2Fe-2S iron-sulfur cluster binding domain
MTAGESLASKAAEQGDFAISSSFRFHRPRGPLCARGYCSQCEIQTETGPALACQAPRGPQDVSRKPDLLRPLGRAAEQFPPWFYERRFLKPRALRGPALHALRYLSSAPPLPEAHGEPSVRSRNHLEVETVTVGSASAPDAYHVDRAEGRLALGLYPDRTLAVLSKGEFTTVHFENIVIGSGGYERLPPVKGNDLPGVIGAKALEIFGRLGAFGRGGFRRGGRAALWAPSDEIPRLRSLTEGFGLEVVWSSERAPSVIVGRGRVTGIRDEGEVRCDLVVVGVVQPALDLAMQGGAGVSLTTGELPILALSSTPDWMTVAGRAAERSSGVPDVKAADDGFACLCEDVRYGDLRACVDQGFRHPELVKRRTGATTGPCQGKLCCAAVLSTLRQLDVPANPTRVRPISYPVRLGDLVADA